MPARDLTVDEFAHLWFEDVAVHVKPQSLHRYEGAYRWDVSPTLGALRLRDVTRFDVRELVARKARDGAGPGTLGMLVRVLSMLFGAAYDQGLLASNPAQRIRRAFPVRTKEALSKAMTGAELARFLEEAERNEAMYVGLFRFMAYSGARLGEARALQVQDLELGELRVAIRRTFAGGSDFTCTPKTGRARRVEIPRALAVELGRLPRRAACEWVFHRNGAPLGDWASRVAFHRVRKSAGLAPHLTPHSLRHTYASLLIQQGVRAEFVQRQLGHQSIGLTLDTYGKWFELSAPGDLDRFVESVSAPESARPYVSKVLPFQRFVKNPTNQPFSAIHEAENDPEDAA